MNVMPAVVRPPLVRSISSQDLARPDAFFVAQLIAMAQHSPQTRMLRRADPQIASDAYHSTTIQNGTVAVAAPRVLRVA
ncbi:MAG: hypothetical protein JSS22_01460 [Proteobacteria bacterium]|nr:hypothetical protein [Pseudomonadota bacterium]